MPTQPNLYTDEQDIEGRASVQGSAALLGGRLAAQRIAGPTHHRPADLVAWMGALQAQNYRAAKWAVGLRLAGGTAAAVEGAVADGSLLRIHAMRGTWQLVAPADVGWILALMGPRALAAAARRFEQLDLDAGTLRRSDAAVERALGPGAHLTRSELADVLEGAGISNAGQRLSYLLWHAELRGVACSGAPRGKQHTWALLEQRVPRTARPLEPEEALAALARRYFQSRGPATARDFAWWSGLKAAEARSALDAVRSSLVSEEIDGQTYWGAERPLISEAAPIAHLLPAFDEYLVAYRDRGAALDPRWAAHVNAGGGLLDPCLVVEGRVVGTWRHTVGRRTVAVHLAPFEPATPAQRQAIDQAAGRFAAFLGVEPSLTVAQPGA